MTAQDDLRKALEVYDGLQRHDEACDWFQAANHLAEAARAALSAPSVEPAQVTQWISVEERMPSAGTECLVWSKPAWQKEHGITIDRWDEQREAPLSFSSAAIPIGLGWDAHDDDSVTHWHPLPLPPAAPSAPGAQTEPTTVPKKVFDDIGDQCVHYMYLAAHRADALEKIAEWPHPHLDEIRSFCMRKTAREALAASPSQREAGRAIPREPTEAMLAAMAATPGMKSVDGMIVFCHIHGQKLAYEEGQSPLHQAWRAGWDAAVAAPSEAPKPEGGEQ